MRYNKNKIRRDDSSIKIRRWKRKNIRECGLENKRQKVSGEEGAILLGEIWESWDWNFECEEEKTIFIC